MAMGAYEAARRLGGADHRQGPPDLDDLGGRGRDPGAPQDPSERDREQVERVLGDFIEVVGDQTSLGVGADGYIRKMLTQALGEDKAGGLIDRILLGGNTSGLDSLKWMEPRAVADVIRYEHPQIQAIVVAYLDPDQAGDRLDAELIAPEGGAAIARVVRLGDVDPAVEVRENPVIEQR